MGCGIDKLSFLIAVSAGKGWGYFKQTLRLALLDLNDSFSLIELHCAVTYRRAEVAERVLAAVRARSSIGGKKNPLETQILSKIRKEAFLQCRCSFGFFVVVGDKMNWFQMKLQHTAMIANLIVSWSVFRNWILSTANHGGVKGRAQQCGRLDESQ